MNKLATGLKTVARAMPLIAIMLVPRFADAAIVEFNMSLFVDYEGDDGLSDCTVEPVDDFYCIPNIAVGERRDLTFSVDTATRLADSDAYYESWGRDPFVWGTFGIWSTTIETSTGPYVPHSGTGTDGDGKPIFYVVDGAVDIFWIYSPTNFDWEGGGSTNIRFSDSTGTAISAADLASAAAFENWVVTRFDASLFDSGVWDLSTYDGGAGAGGRIDLSAPTAVPEPSTLALMLAAMLGLVAFSRRQEPSGVSRR